MTITEAGAAMAARAACSAGVGAATGGGFFIREPAISSIEELTAFAEPLTYDIAPSGDPIPAEAQADRYKAEVEKTLSDISAIAKLEGQLQRGEGPSAFDELSKETKNYLLEKGRGTSSREEALREINDGDRSLLRAGLDATKAMLILRLNFSPIDINIAPIRGPYAVSGVGRNEADIRELGAIKTALENMRSALHEVRTDGTYIGIDFTKLEENFRILPVHVRNYLRGAVYHSSQANGKSVGNDFGERILDNFNGFALIAIHSRSDESKILDKMLAQYEEAYPTRTYTSSMDRIRTIALTQVETAKDIERIPRRARVAKEVEAEFMSRSKQVAQLRVLRTQCSHAGTYVHEDNARGIIHRLGELAAQSGDPHILQFLINAFHPDLPKPATSGRDLGDISLLRRIIARAEDPVTRAPTLRTGLDMLIEYAETSALLSTMEYALTLGDEARVAALAGTSGIDIVEHTIADMSALLASHPITTERNRMRDRVLDLRIELGTMIRKASEEIHHSYCVERGEMHAKRSVDPVPSLEAVRTDMGIADDPSIAGRKLKVLVTSIETAAYSIGGLGPAVHGATQALPSDKYDAVIMTPYHNSVNADLRARVVAKVAGGDFSTVTHSFGGIEQTDRLVEVEFKGAKYLFHIEGDHIDGELRDKRLYRVDAGATLYSTGGYESELLRMAYFSSAVAKVAMSRFADGLMYDNVVINDSHSATAMRLLEADHYQDRRYGKTPAFSFMVHNNGFHTKLPSRLARDWGESEFNAHWYAVKHADTVATVSPHHAVELMGPEEGNSIEGTYQDRAYDDAFFGILNGISTAGHNPATDKTLRSIRVVDLEGMTFEPMPASVSTSYEQLGEVLKADSHITVDVAERLNTDLKDLLDNHSDLLPDVATRDELTALQTRLESKFTTATAAGELVIDISELEPSIRSAQAKLNTAILESSLAFTERDEHIVEKKRMSKRVLETIYNTHYKDKAGMPGSESNINFFDADGNERPVMFYVGRYDAKQKGLQRFREALYAAKHNGAVLIVMGTPEEGVFDGRTASSYLDELEDLSRSERPDGDAPEWGGTWVIREDKKQAGETAKYPYQMGCGDRPGIGNLIRTAADFLYSPSNYEPCGLTPPEAAMRGAALAVTRTGGFVDWVAKAGEGSATLDLGGDHYRDLAKLLTDWKTEYRDKPVERKALCSRLMELGKASDWKFAIRNYEYMMAIARRRRHLRDARIVPAIGSTTIQKAIESAPVG